MSDAVERSLIERRPALEREVRRRFARGPAAGAAGSELALPIWTGNELWGALDLQSSEPDAFDDADIRLLEAVAHQIGSALRSATQFERLERAYIDTVEALSTALEQHDGDLRDQVRSIVERAEAVGRRLGMAGDELRNVRYAAALHDLAKLALPESILNKPGPLTDDERRAVERQSVESEQILARVDYLEDVLPLLRHSHERWDGGGYPDGLAGERIPLGARVIGVCRAHAAMLRDRPYRKALAEPTALAELKDLSGVQFDPKAADALVEAVGTKP